MGKHCRLPSHIVTDRTIMPNELVHADIWGPAHTASHGGSKYFLTCSDDHTRHIRIYCLKAKLEALQKSKEYIALVQNHCKTTIEWVHTDNGAEFTSQAFQKLLADNDILANRVPPDARSQNGRVVRAHLIILNGVGTLFINTSLWLTF
jgi:transposase InsO family protein